MKMNDEAYTACHQEGENLQLQFLKQDISILVLLQLKTPILSQLPTLSVL